LEDFESKEVNHSGTKPHDGSISLVLKRLDGVPHRIHLPSLSDLFKSLGGESRKTEDKNPPVDLAQLLAAVAWSVFADGKIRQFCLLYWIGSPKMMELIMLRIGSLS
jgi:hypothetical protein